MRRVLAVSALLAASCSTLGAGPRAKLQVGTIAAFDDYVAAVEQELQTRLDGGDARFLGISTDRDWRTSLRGGAVNPVVIQEGLRVPGGLIQDWTATAFVPSVSGEDVIALLTDYDTHAEVYDEVIAGKALSRDGDMIRSELRLRKHKIITIVLDTEHELAVVGGDGRWQLHSHSTRINQVRRPGEPDETLLPEGEDGGFLWRINAYWSIQEVDDGVYVECRTTTLTRGIPFGLGWVVKRFTLALPRESLVATLEATRDELARRSH